MNKASTYQDTQLLFQIVLEMPKADSSFLYFILEAMDNLCFYSTMGHEVGTMMRQVEITCPIEHKMTLQKVLDDLKSKLTLKICSEKIFADVKASC